MLDRPRCAIGLARQQEHQHRPATQRRAWVGEHAYKNLPRWLTWRTLTRFQNRCRA